jgi:hypothetical protein
MMQYILEARAQTADNMELGEAVYGGTTYYAIKNSS